jgi:type I restriction-modification system DNA methylase subunit
MKKEIMHVVRSFRAKEGAGKCKYFYFLNVFRYRPALAGRIDQRSNLLWNPRNLFPAARPQGVTNYKDIKGMRKAATLEEIRAHDDLLNPGRYV